MMRPTNLHPVLPPHSSFAPVLPHHRVFTRFTPRGLATGRDRFAPDVERPFPLLTPRPLSSLSSLDLAMRSGSMITPASLRIAGRVRFLHLATQEGLEDQCGEHVGSEGEPRPNLYDSVDVGLLGRGIAGTGLLTGNEALSPEGGVCVEVPAEGLP